MIACNGHLDVSDISSVYGNLPAKLMKFLAPSTKEVYSPLFGKTIIRASISRPIAKTRVWLGPTGSFYAEDETEYETERLPPMLQDFIENSTRYDNRLLFLTLGHGGSFFAAFQNGAFHYNLVPCSKALDQAMDELIYYRGVRQRKKNPIKITDIEVDLFLSYASACKVY